MYLKKFIIFILIAILLGLPSKSFAHVLLTDQSIGAVMHINPDDDPIVGRLSSFFFDFKDKTGKFDPTQCDCKFQIIENNMLIYSQPLFSNNQTPGLSNTSAFYTFPKKDIYSIRITGKPLASNLFQPFTLKYDLRVSRVVSATSSKLKTSQPSVTAIIVITLALIVIIFSIFKNSRNKNKDKEVKNEKKINISN